MTQVDFYVLNVDARTDGGNFPCRLTEKAYRSGLKVFIHTSSEQETALLDDLLWTFKQGSFLPHARVTENKSGPNNALVTPILISARLNDNHNQGILINLSAEVADLTKNFKRIAEVVYNDDVHKRAARARFRHYRDNGYSVKSHEISSY